MTPKEIALRTIMQMPAEATWVEVMREIDLQATLEGASCESPDDSLWIKDMRRMISGHR